MHEVPNIVYLVVRADWEEYTIKGVYFSQEDAETALKEHGYHGFEGKWYETVKDYESARNPSLWNAPLEIDTYKVGWRSDA